LRVFIFFAFQYFRFALGQPTRDRTYQTRGQLDKQSQCGVCSNANCDEDNSQKCLLCNSVFHKLCEQKWMEMFHIDGSWLCTVCHEIERAWSKEDFEFEEEDTNDLQERAFWTGEKKAAASRRCRDKKQGKTTKKVKENNIECIDLSSDEEEIDKNGQEQFYENSFDENNYGNDDGDIYYVEETGESFFFGFDTSNIDNNETGNADYKTGNRNDPFGEAVFAEVPNIETENADHETGNSDHKNGNFDHETGNADHETRNSDHETGNSNDYESRLKSKFLDSIENTQEESDDEEEIFILS
jgi:hypothetical protein